MAYSYNVYTGNGSTTQFTIGFSYIRREHVAVTVAGVPSTFTWVNNGLIQMDAAPANGAAVRVYRTTPISAPLVDFADGATLVAADLDTNSRQSIYIQQELDDAQTDNLPNVIPNGDKGDITTSVGGTVWAIDTGAVTETKIGTNAVTETKLGTGAVTSAKILDGTIVNADINASAGITAGKLSFTQAGTGAVARTVDSRLKDVVSVKDFGAVGDGVVDDTAAIQAAFNAKSSVFFPRGQYNISSTLIVKNNARIIGELPQSNSQLSPNEVRIYGTVANIGDGNPMLRLHDGTYNVNQSVSNRQASIIIENIAFESNKSVDFSNLSITTSAGVTGVDVSAVNNGLEFIQCSFTRMAYGVRQYTLEPYLDKVTFTRCHFTLLYTAIECGPTAGLSLDNTWIYDCYDWVNAQARNNSIPVPTPSTLFSNRGSEVFLNASSFNNSSASSNNAGISANAITAIGCWFEGGNRWLNPKHFAKAESCYFSEAIEVSGARFSIDPAGNNCTVIVSGCRIGTNTRLIDLGSAADKKTISVTCIGNYNGNNFSDDANINTYLSLGLDYEGYGNWNSPSQTWNISQHDRDVAVGKALPEARLHLLKNSAGVGVYARISDTSSSGGKAGIILERTQSGAGDFKIEDVLGECVISSSNDAITWTDRVKLHSSWAWTPAADNTQTLGTAALRWSVVYAGTGTINTSDANQKQQIAVLSSVEQKVAQQIKGLIRTFKFNDAVIAKGSDARIHVGVIAQDVAQAFQAEGLDPSAYGLFCRDTYYELNGKEVVIEGNMEIPDGAIQATRLGIRYEELLAFIISAL